jgi:hypothetical protein
MSQRRSSLTGFFRRAERCVETSDDVIDARLLLFTKACQAFYAVFGLSLLLSANNCYGRAVPDLLFTSPMSALSIDPSTVTSSRKFELVTR